MSGVTRGQAVLSAIRSDILNGHLEPGSKLGFAELSRTYAASTGVLREVLPRLVEQGLATTQAQLGYRVVTVSVAELEHLSEARVAIETQVLRQSIHAGDLNWEAKVVAATHRLMQVPTHTSDHEVNPEWMLEHREFHRVLLEGCPNEQLRHVADRLRTVNEIYHCWAVREMSDHAERDAEHRAIAAAAVLRDEDEAVRQLTQHIETTTRILLASKELASQA